jgi:hypothetical protein
MRAATTAAILAGVLLAGCASKQVIPLKETFAGTLNLTAQGRFANPYPSPSPVDQLWVWLQTCPATGACTNLTALTITATPAGTRTRSGSWDLIQFPAGTRSLLVNLQILYSPPSGAGICWKDFRWVAGTATPPPAIAPPNLPKCR